MDHRSHPRENSDRSERRSCTTDSTTDARADASIGQARRKGRLLGELLRGLAFSAAGLLLATTPLLLGTLPLGVALLAASSSYTWWIAGGCIAGVFWQPHQLTSWAWTGVYIFLLILRICIRFFVDPPSRPDGRPLSARVYLGLCWTSFLRNIGIETEESTPRVYRSSEMQLFGEHPFLRMLTATVAGFSAGLFGMIIGGFHVYDLLGTLFLMVACPLCTLLLVSCFGDAGLTLLFSASPLRDTPVRKDLKSRRLVLLRDGGVGSVLARFRALALIGTLGFLCILVLSARGRYFPSDTLASGAFLRVELSLLLSLLFSLFATARLGVVPGLAVAIAVGLAASPALAPILILTAGGYALLRAVSPRAGVLGGCTVGAVWCASVEGLSALVTRLPSLLLAIPLYLLLDRISVALPLADMPAHTDREVEGFTASVSAALAAENRARAQRARLCALSEAFAALSRRFYDLSGQLRRPRAADLRRICDEAMSEHCTHCHKQEVCRECEYHRIRELRAKLVAKLERDERITADTLPASFFEVCPHADSILETINRKYAHLREMLNKSEKTDVFAADYASIAALLGDALEADRIESETMGGNQKTADLIYRRLSESGMTVHGVAVTGRAEQGRRRVILQGEHLPTSAAESRAMQDMLEEVCGVSFSPPAVENGEDGSTVMTFSPRTRLQTVYSGCSVPANHTGDPLPPLTQDSPSATLHTYPANTVCGDHVALFHSGDAYFYALISDGMGSGEEASVTSEICAMFLEKMLSAGSSAALSIRMLDGYLHAKNTGTGGECSATVDLMELDLMDGRAVFAKSGAAPTYVVRDGTVYKLRSRSLPLGILKNTSPELLKFRMNPGDVVVMVSDGVTRGQDECPWLIDLLSSPMPRSMDKLRHDIIRRALHAGSEDDLSAIAIRVENRY